MVSSQGVKDHPLMQDPPPTSPGYRWSSLLCRSCGTAPPPVGGVALIRRMGCWPGRGVTGNEPHSRT